MTDTLLPPVNGMQPALHAPLTGWVPGACHSCGSTTWHVWAWQYRDEQGDLRTARQPVCTTCHPSARPFREPNPAG